jgi:UDP-glucose 4-epimerase
VVIVAKTESYCIVGARGFIGSHLVRGLEANSNEVTRIERGALRELGGALNKAAPLDFIDRDAAFFLASAAGPGCTPMEVARDNLNTFENFLDCCVAAQIPRVILLSSGGAVYGKAQYLPIDEIHPTNPLSPYGRLMLELEALLMGRISTGGVVLRASNVYGRKGPLHHSQGVIENFYAALRTGRRIPVRGSLDNVRDFLHVSDAVRGLIAASRYSGPTVVLNLGSGVGTSIAELAESVSDLLGVRPRFSMAPSAEFDPAKNVLNVGKAREILDFSSTISLSEGLRRHMSVPLRRVDKEGAEDPPPLQLNQLDPLNYNHMLRTGRVKR